MRGVWLGVAAWLLALAMLMPAVAGGNEGNEAETVIQALEADGAVVTDVRFRASIPLRKQVAKKELVYLAEKWGKTLSLPSIVWLSDQNGLLMSEAVQEFEGGRQQIRLIGALRGERWDAHLVVVIEGKRSHLQDIVSMRQKMLSNMRRAGLVPQFSTCIRGFYNDTLSVGQQERKIEELLQSLRARETERLHDETVISVSALTDRWESRIVTGVHEMNVQVATHVDAHQHLTRITVGTPIITAEY